MSKLPKGFSRSRYWLYEHMFHEMELAAKYGVAEGTIRGIQAGRWGLAKCA